MPETQKADEDLREAMRAPDPELDAEGAGSFQVLVDALVELQEVDPALGARRAVEWEAKPRGPREPPRQGSPYAGSALQARRSPGMKAV